MLKSWTASSSALAYITRRALPRLPSGMTIRVLRYHSPRVGTSRASSSTRASWMRMAEQNSFRNRSPPPLPAETEAAEPSAETPAAVSELEAPAEPESESPAEPEQEPEQEPPAETPAAPSSKAI